MNKAGIQRLICLIILISKSFYSQCTFTSSVPYIQSFNSISTASPLPTCWARSSSVTCVTYTGSAQAAFFYNPAGPRYFWSNGIQLDAGVIYSTSIVYSTNNSTYFNWGSLSILLGTAQTTVGLTGVATLTNVSSLGYSTLSGTFSVPGSGIYYMAVNAVSSGNFGASYLYFDDLTISIPCSHNPVPINAGPANVAICVGDTLTVSATGADTYTWNTNSNSSSITVVPGTNALYVVNGTSTLTGCVSATTVNVTVNPRPIMSIISSTTDICEGSYLNLASFGSTSAIWSTGSNSPNITVSPSVSTVYFINGWNSFGCTGTSSLQINVWPVPVITTTLAKSPICFGEYGQIIASGANSYTWSSPIASASSPTILFLATAHTIFTVNAMGSNGCVGKYQVVVNLSQCLGKEEEDLENDKLIVYPNPGKGVIYLKTINDTEKLPEVIDKLGRRMSCRIVYVKNGLIQISEIPEGIYFIRLESENKFYHSKVVVEK